MYNNKNMVDFDSNIDKNEFILLFDDQDLISKFGVGIEVINKLKSCVLNFNMYEYRILVKELGSDLVNSFIDFYIVKLFEDGDFNYEKQVIVWEKFGYYFSCFEHSVFEKITLDNLGKIDNSEAALKRYKKDLLSLEEERIYGIYLLARPFINIIISGNAKNEYLDVRKIFGSIKTIECRDAVLKKFTYLYNICSRTSNFDNKIKLFLDEYNSLCKNNNIPTLDILDSFGFEKCDNVFLNEDELLEQLDMYIRYSVAMERFILGNQKLIGKVAMSYLDCGLDEEDLIAYGYFGLVNSIKSFDVRKGVNFSTYGVTGIKMDMMRSISNFSRVVRIPASKIQMKYTFEKAYVELSKKLGRTPTKYEHAQELGKSIDEIDFFAASLSIANIDSLDRPVPLLDGNGELTQGSIIADKLNLAELVVDDVFFKDFCCFLKSILSEREIEILFMINGYYGDEMTNLRRIGEYFGVSKQRIDQIHKQVKCKLRKHPAYDKYRRECL